MMNMFIEPLEYDEPVFRPPAEAYSLIFQVTLGCSWNRCAFCEMYTSKQFKVRDETAVLNEIKQMGKIYSGVRKIFLADGNAMVLSTPKLLTILKAVREAFGSHVRVSAYALPRDVLSKTPEELEELKAAGLQLLYVGIETGDDEILELVDKNETAETTVNGLLKAQNAGMNLSVMIVNGLAGKKYSQQHAVNSANVINRIQPRFFSTLVLTTPFGEDHYRKRFKGEYQPMTGDDLLQEMEWLIGHTQLERTIFRSNHVSNFLALKGNLGRDKEKFLREIRDCRSMDHDFPMRSFEL